MYVYVNVCKLYNLCGLFYVNLLDGPILCIVFFVCASFADSKLKIKKDNKFKMTKRVTKLIYKFAFCPFYSFMPAHAFMLPYKDQISNMNVQN